VRAGGRVVLNNLSEQIRDCLKHAEECAHSANAQISPALRNDFLQLEKLWRELAQSMESDSRSFPNTRPNNNEQPSSQ
jgi:hypothetical protein